MAEVGISPIFIICCYIVPFSFDVTSLQNWVPLCMLEIRLVWGSKEQFAISNYTSFLISVLKVTCVRELPYIPVTSVVECVCVGAELQSV